MLPNSRVDHPVEECNHSCASSERRAEHPSAPMAREKTFSVRSRIDDLGMFPCKNVLDSFGPGCAGTIERKATGCSD